MNKVKTIIISFAICIAWICILNTSVVHAEVNVKPSTYATSYLYNAQRLTLGEETSQFFTSEEGEDGKYTGYLGYAVSFTTGSKNSFYEITEINRFGNSVTFELYDADKVIITGKTKSISASGKNTMSLKLDKNSTYYILAYTRNMANVAPGDVSILVKEINDDCGDTFKSATTISIGKTVNGKIDGYGDVDIYKFKTKADNGYYAIDFINTDSEAFLAMNLFDTKEVEKKYVYVQTGKQSQIYMQLKKNSTYYLHVESKTANITGKYKIKVSYHEDPEGDTVKTAYKLKIKAKAYNGSLQDKDDNDTFRVDTGNLTKINIVIANKKSDGKLNYNIIEKDGNRIKYGTIDAGRTMDIIVDGLRRNKDYYIVLTGPQHLNYEIKAKTVTHKIIYRLSGGKNNPQNADTYDETKPYRLAAPSKKGYLFICWCSDSNLTNKITEIPKTATKKVTIYAKWKKVTVNKPVIVSVKRKADYVTGTVEEDGIFNALEELGLVEKELHFPQLDLDAVEGPVATIKTNHGDLVIKLFPDHAPLTVTNFVNLAKSGYYDGVIFHRIIKDFMIQGGDPTGTGMGGESSFGGSFQDEFSEELYNLRGALSMANAGPDTNGSQFFIVQTPEIPYAKKELERGGWPAPIAEAYAENGGTPHLDRRHTVFGQLVDEDSYKVLDEIANVEVGAQDKPLEDVVIETVEVAD